MSERPEISETWAGGGSRPGPTWKTILGLALAVGGLLAALQGWWLVARAPALQTGSRVVEIPPRLGLSGVAQRLEDAGVVRSRLGFMAAAAALGRARSLKAGEYEIPQGANALAILRLLEAGKVIQHPVVLREGSTLADLARGVETERLAPADAVLRVARDPAFLRELGVEGESLEGYLFPDTYQLVRGMTPEDILTRMVTRMRDQISVETLGLARSREITVHQLLTLASIIEREAADRREMPLISAVFWNRLKRDIPLQADPTVQYAVNKQGQALTRDDLQVESPFNTYRRLGLPPGPIASPSRAAIDAAVRPAAVDYLYFVAMNDRQHRFSTSLAEHNAAVARYRLTRPR
jgi:UPF0755 protein